jgi:hypothetical protein
VQAVVRMVKRLSPQFSKVKVPVIGQTGEVNRG